MIYIYALKDPFTNAIRYIGKSIRPRERLTNECNEQGNTYRCHWIQKLLRQGVKPIQIILETLPNDADWKERERYWIAVGKRLDWPLVNSTSGGDGVPDLPPEIRAKISATWLGRKHRPESLKKIGAASKGRTHTEEYKQMMHDKMSVRVFTETHRRRLSLGARRFTPEQTELILALIESGMVQQIIADSFGVHRTTITAIKFGSYD